MAKKTYCVAIYETNQGYGGPEEGGWYYPCGVPSDDPDLMAHTKVFVAETDDLEEDWMLPDEVREYRDNLRKNVCDVRNEEENERYRPSSVLCSGWLDVLITDDYPKPFPEVIPHYE